MKILIVECTAEELRENRTVMDTLNETLSNFTRPLFGVDIDVSKVSDVSDDTQDEEYDGEL